MCRRSPDEPYARDAGPPVRLPDEVEERCGFILYPYVSWTFAEAVSWSVHEDALEQLRAGAPHPAREGVLELARLAEAHCKAWTALGDREREWVVSRGTPGEKPMPGELSAGLRKYLDLDEKVTSVSRMLRAHEVEKIRRALAELDNWLQNWR